MGVERRRGHALPSLRRCTLLTHHVIHRAPRLAGGLALFRVHRRHGLIMTRGHCLSNPTLTPAIDRSVDRSVENLPVAGERWVRFCSDMNSL